MSAQTPAKSTIQTARSSNALNFRHAPPACTRMPVEAGFPSWQSRPPRSHTASDHVRPFPGRSDCRSTGVRGTLGRRQPSQPPLAGASVTPTSASRSPALILHATVPYGPTAMLASTSSSPGSSAVITTKPSSCTRTPAIRSPKVEQRTRTAGSACQAAAAAVVAPASAGVDHRLSRHSWVLISPSGRARDPCAVLALNCGTIPVTLWWCSGGLG